MLSPGLGAAPWGPTHTAPTVSCTSHGALPPESTALLSRRRQRSTRRRLLARGVYAAGA